MKNTKKAMRNEQRLPSILRLSPFSLFFLDLFQMKVLRLNIFFIVFFLILVLPYGCKTDKKVFHQENEAVGENNITYRWAEISLEATAKDTERFRPRPTITSRYLALVFVSMFDAWSRYDSTAHPVYLNDVDRTQADEQTIENKKKAISYAAFRALNEYYYSDTALFQDFMIELGYDPENTSLDPSTPEGVGNLAAKAVIEARENDGSNQYGTMVGSDGNIYYDYTDYRCINTPDSCFDINRWQPKYFSDGKGGKFAPECLTPFWHKVKPVALDSASQFRPGPPPFIGSEHLEKEVQEVVDLQANLTDEQKALVEFMRDGPSSVQQAGHWLKFAMDVSRRDDHTMDEDVKMFMLVEVTAMDAFIACWDAKMIYDFARPFALVHHYFKDRMIRGWGGPDKGIVDTKGQNWVPYSPETFVCPPFPAYVSGHSTVSGGCAEVLKLFTGNDYFDEEVKWVPGSMTEIKNFGDTVTLKLPTFTETADMAGFSRVLGGYHIQADNVEGLKLGRRVGHAVWDWYEELIGL